MKHISGILLKPFIAVMVLSYGCCSAPTRSPGGKSPIDESDTAYSASAEVALLLDWDRQINGGDDSELSSAVKPFSRVRAVVMNTSYPVIDSGSVGGPFDRSAILSLPKGERISGMPQVRIVLLVSTVPGLMSDFLIRGKTYTIIFDSRGRLFDILNDTGTSGMLSATGMYEKVGDKVWK